MMQYTEPIRILSPDEMERIHQAALAILNTIGMKVNHPVALEYLRKHGCLVDTATQIVKFPPQIVQASVDRMRQAYAQPARIPERMSVRYSHIRFRTEPHRIHQDFTVSAGGFCCFIHDLRGNRRNANGDDVRRAISMVNQLNQVNYTGLPVSDQETPSPLRPVAMAAEIAKYTTKIGGVETFSKEDIPYLLEIATIVKGSEDAVRREPILIGYGETRTPLCFDYNMIEIFMEYIRRGFPQTVETMPNAGATAPVTFAGTLALGAAETLAPVVLAHAIDPDAVIGVDINPSTCDMRSGLFRYSAPERWTVLIARVQLISEYYGCPSGVHGGKTDSCFYDEQAGFEKGLSMLMPVLAGVVGVGTVGHIENAVTFSPLQLVMDNEFAAAIRMMLKGIEVNDETLALDTIKQVGIGGNYLETDHTAEHFRDTIFMSPLMPHQPWGHALTGDMAEHARQQARTLWEAEPQPVLDDARRKAVEAVVAKARLRLLGS